MRRGCVGCGTGGHRGHAEAEVLVGIGKGLSLHACATVIGRDAEGNASSHGRHGNNRAKGVDSMCNDDSCAPWHDVRQREGLRVKREGGG